MSNARTVVRYTPTAKKWKSPPWVVVAYAIFDATTAVCDHWEIPVTLRVGDTPYMHEKLAILMRNFTFQIAYLSDRGKVFGRGGTHFETGDNWLRRQALREARSEHDKFFWQWCALMFAGRHRHKRHRA